MQGSEFGAREGADCMHCGRYAFMGAQITIRDVRAKVRHVRAARAAAQGRSMQEYLRMALARLAARPSADAWLKQVQRRKRATGNKVAAQQILRSRDAARRWASSLIRRSSLPPRSIPVPAAEWSVPQDRLRPGG